MIEDIREDIAQARTRFEAVETLIRDGFYGIALANIYYACFYYLQAMLRTRGTAYQTHKGILIGFDKSFIADGTIPREIGAFLRRLARERFDADYAAARFTKEEVISRLENAKKFAALAEEHLAAYLPKSDNPMQPLHDSVVGDGDDSEEK